MDLSNKALQFTFAGGCKLNLNKLHKMKEKKPELQKKIFDSASLNVELIFENFRKILKFQSARPFETSKLFLDNKI